MNNSGTSLIARSSGGLEELSLPRNRTGGEDASRVGCFNSDVETRCGEKTTIKVITTIRGDGSIGEALAAPV